MPSVFTVCPLALASANGVFKVCALAGASSHSVFMVHALATLGASMVLIVSYDSFLDSRGNSFRSLDVLIVLVTSTSSCGPRDGVTLVFQDKQHIEG